MHFLFFILTICFAKDDNSFSLVPTWDDPKVPYSERSDRYQENMDYLSAHGGPRDMNPEKFDFAGHGITCADDPKYASIPKQEIPGVRAESVCYFQVKVECDNSSRIEVKTPINWSLAERKGTLRMDAASMIYVPIKKSETNALVKLEVGRDVTITPFKKNATLKVANDNCQKPQ